MAHLTPSAHSCLGENVPENADNILHKPAKADAHLLESLPHCRGTGGPLCGMPCVSMLCVTKQLEFFWLPRVPSVNGSFFPFCAPSWEEAKLSVGEQTQHEIQSALRYAVLKGALLGKLTVKTRMLTDDRKARLDVEPIE